MALQAKSGIARSGSSRSGSVRLYVLATIAGIADATVRSALTIRSLRVDLSLNAPARATFTLKPGTSVPALGTSVAIALGSYGDGHYIFTGMVVRCDVTRREGNLGHPFIEVEAEDYTRILDRYLVTRTWINTPVDEIVTDLIQEHASPIVALDVTTGLSTVPEFRAEGEPISALLNRLVALAGGGGWYMSSRTLGNPMAVRFFGPAGDTLPDAPTPPAQLNASRGTLMELSQGHDARQIRNRVVALGRSTPLRWTIPSGTDYQWIYTYGFPVGYGFLFSASGGTVLVADGIAMAYEGRVAALGPPAGVTSGAAAIGAATVSLTSDTSFVTNGTRWFTPDGQQFFYGECASGGSNEIANIPTSGYGSLGVAIPSGTPIYAADSLTGTYFLDYGIPAAAPGSPEGVTTDADISVDSSVRVRNQQDDAAEQAALAPLEGTADGVRMHQISGEWDDGAALHAAQADLEAFADADGLPDITWTTRDLNARPGAVQALSFAGIGAISESVTITSASLTWVKDRYPPIRQCRGESVRLPQIADVLAQTISRT